MVQRRPECAAELIEVAWRWTRGPQRAEAQARWFAARVSLQCVAGSMPFLRDNALLAVPSSARLSRPGFVRRHGADRTGGARPHEGKAGCRARFCSEGLAAKEREIRGYIEDNEQMRATESVSGLYLKHYC
jgi:hypothetical protein